MNLKQTSSTILIVIFVNIYVGNAQSVGINNPTPDNSAVLDVKSTGKGMLIPRMNSGQRTGITSPAIGLLVFDTDTESFWYRQSTGWFELTNGAFTNNAGTVKSTGNHDADDFVFGAASLPPATAISDTLMFFDKSKGAFRTGLLDNSNVWKESSLGYGSFAAGRNARASGSYSSAFGTNNIASGPTSNTFGSGNISSGTYATTFGYLNNATGTASTALGNFTSANAQFSLALGTYNVGNGDANNYIPTDPILEVGIGTSNSNKKMHLPS